MAHRFGRRLGLRARMALSYLVATVSVVVVSQFVLARVLVGDRGPDLATRTLNTAVELAKRITTSAQPLKSVQVGDAALPVLPGRSTARGDGLAVPLTRDPGNDLVTVVVVLDTADIIAASSAPARFPIGAAVSPLLPETAARTLESFGLQPSPKSIAAIAARGDAPVTFALAALPLGGKPAVTTGWVYVETPGTKIGAARIHVSTVGAIVVLALPVGLLFGMVSTTNLRRRLRGLAAVTTAVAEGDFDHRIVPSSSDELGRLEQNFNDMAARLSAAGARELALAADNGRLAERSRISRELHDSLSQELFSLNMLAGGLRNALPSDSPLQAQITQLVVTTGHATQELRALLLDLHPTAVAERGLLPAIEEMCATYRARFDLEVVTVLDEVTLDPEHTLALTRITQEGLANAVKHADATRVTVRLATVDAAIELAIADDGAGFDTSGSTRGFGLRLMRERVAELGGSLLIDSSADGTRLVVRVAAQPSAPSREEAAVAE